MIEGVVQSVVYLLFNEGYSSSIVDRLNREELRRQCGGTLRNLIPSPTFETLVPGLPLPAPLLTRDGPGSMPLALFEPWQGEAAADSLEQEAAAASTALQEFQPLGQRRLEFLAQAPGSESKRFIQPGQLEKIAASSAWERLRQIDFLALPDLTKPPPTEIPPLLVVPKINGLFSVVGIALNQLLGFLVAYQPRLFLAALLAGAWTGWRWQRRLATLKTRVVNYSRGDSDSIPLRRAA